MLLLISFVVSAVCLVVLLLATLLVRSTNCRDRVDTPVQGIWNFEILDELDLIEDSRLGTHDRDYAPWYKMSCCGRLSVTAEQDGFLERRIKPFVKFNHGLMGVSFLFLLHTATLGYMYFTCKATTSQAVREIVFLWLVTIGSSYGYAAILWHRDKLMNVLFDLLPVISSRDGDQLLAKREVAVWHLGSIRAIGYNRLRRIVLTVVIGGGLLFAYSSIVVPHEWMPKNTRIVFSIDFFVMAAVLGAGVSYMYASAKFITQYLWRIGRNNPRIYLPDVGRDIGGLCSVHLQGCWVAIIVYVLYLLAVSIVGWSGNTWATLAIIILALVVLAYILAPYIGFLNLRRRYKEDRIRYRTNKLLTEQSSGAEGQMSPKCREMMESLQKCYDMPESPLCVSRIATSVATVFTATGINLSGVLSRIF